jgi:regulator of protease activity HflC (stomatin/prohibitin superfamily)
MNIAPDSVSLLPAAGLCAAALLLLLAVGLRRVPEGYALVIQRLGRYRRTLGPGWHLTVPVLDRATHTVTLLGHHVAVHADQRPAEFEVYYQILEPSQTGQAIAEVDALVRREALERLAALSAETESVEGPALATRLKDELNRQVNRLGLMVIRCQLHVPTL